MAALSKYTATSKSTLRGDFFMANVRRVESSQSNRWHIKRKEAIELFLEIILDRDFDPSILDGKKYRRRGNIITANGTKEEMLAIIKTLESVGGGRTIIMREVKNEQKD